MSTCYLDTSALIKRYLNERGTAWLEALCDPHAGNVIAVCDLTLVEFTSTLARRQREGTVSEANAEILTERFLTDFKRQYLSVPLESRIMLSARDRIRASPVPLRSLDAIQLACALEAKYLLDEAILLIVADKRLLDAAANAGLATDNPNDHP